MQDKIELSIYKLYSQIRKLMIPFKEISNEVPRKAIILEVGCGHGVLSSLIARKKNNCNILGIDPSVNKIRMAKKLWCNYKNLKFVTGYIYSLKKQKFDVIIINDVLYLLPDKEKFNLIKKSRSMLSKKGILIVNESKKNIFIIIEEKIIINLFKITYTDYGKTYFCSENKYKSIFKKAKLKISSIYKPKTLLPYNHMLFITKK